ANVDAGGEADSGKWTEQYLHCERTALAQEACMKEREIVIGHRLGLHARAAAQLGQLSAKYQSGIVLSKRGASRHAEADVRSILSILLLAAGFGSRLHVRTDGPDEDEALNKVCEYLSG